MSDKALNDSHKIYKHIILQIIVVTRHNFLSLFRILVDGLMDTVAPVTDEELEIYKVGYSLFFDWFGSL